MMQSYLLFVLYLIACCNVQTSLTQNCRTPKATAGQCVPYGNCKYVVDLYRNYGNNIPSIWQNFLMQSRCITSDQTQRLCCDLTQIRNTMQTINIRTTTTTTTQMPNHNARPSYTNNLPSPSSSVYDNIIFATEQGNFEATLNRNAVNLLRNFTCGISNNDRVSFGNVTKVGEYPWVALLRYDNQVTPFQCGGSLVSHRYVVTAAHCFDKNTNDNLIGVRLGEHDIEQEEDCFKIFDQRHCYKAEDFEIESTYAHPNYSVNLKINDVGLIRLSRDVVFKYNIQPICLPLTNLAAQVREYPDKYIIAGWGRTETDAVATKMIKAELPSQNRSYCKNIYKLKLRIQTAHICAGGENRVDSCKGDSGGPLFASTLYERTSRYVLYGIVSFGVVKCGDENSYPGIYTNVVEYMPWITDNMF